MSNNENNGDLDVEPFDDAGFDDYNEKGAVGEALRNNSMVKIGIILAVVALVLGVVLFFGGDESKKDISTVSGASDVSEAPGSSAVSETMKQSIQDKSTELVEQALRTDGSAVPIPLQPSRNEMPVPDMQTPQEDPLERWKRMQEERIRQQEALQKARPAAQPQMTEPQVDTRTPAINALAQSMSAQMQGILQGISTSDTKHTKVATISFIEEKQKAREDAMKQKAAAQAAVGLNGQQNTVNDQVENIVVPAGTIEYGQLILEANTDAPGPVMVQIISGPLRGSRLMGSFQSTDDYLILNFSTIIIDGIDYPVQAVAIDPDTTMPGVITEIDRRYFGRVILPMAAEFVSGLAEAISESGTTSVYISDSNVTQSTGDKDNEQEVASGISEAGDKLSELIDEEAGKIKPMLRVAAGTPVGILFTAPVVDDALDTR